MKRTAKTPRAKSAKSPIHLSNFGCVNALYFDKGGTARVQMNATEIDRLCDALQRYILRKQKMPDPKLLAALDKLQEFFSVGGKGWDITVTADMVIAGHGVYLEPILKEIG